MSYTVAVHLYQQVFHILIQSGTMLALSALNYNMMNSAWIVVLTNSTMSFNI